MLDCTLALCGQKRPRRLEDASGANEPNVAEDIAAASNPAAGVAWTRRLDKLLVKISNQF